jgi:hypothetical protein
MTTNFPPSPSVLNAIKMTAEQAEQDPRRASILAGRYLRMLGFERRYNHLTWDKGMRWFSPSGQIYNASNTDVLAYALAA